MLEHIEQDGPISRVALAAALGLSQPTVSQVVAELMAARLVEEVGTGLSRGGRRPVLLQLSDQAGYIAAVDLGGTRSRLALFTLRGHRLVDETGALPAATTPEQAVRLIADQVRRITRAAPVPKPLLAVGVAVPGVTDPATGVVKLAPALGWEEAPLGHLLAVELGLPVVLDNDVNAAALAELRFGDGRAWTSFVFVWVGTGVGAGIVLDGQLYRGSGNCAGEIGYLIVDGPGPERQGPLGFGHLERRLAIPYLVERARAAHLARPTADDQAALGALFTAAREGRPEASAVVDEVIERLARALTNVAVILAPQAIVLGGPVGALVQHIVPQLAGRLRALSPIVPEIRASRLGDRAGLVGAAALAAMHAKASILERFERG
ncbi:MAG: ROK family transcriptional regulator [Limnochordaceae bacterium]|nr:ROK family transcriptional regulator [Limnochordaceae bacterium]